MTHTLWPQYLSIYEHYYVLGRVPSPFHCEMKIPLAILINKKCHSHQRFLTSKCEWGCNPVVAATLVVSAEELGEYKSKANKQTGLAPESCSVYDRNELNDPLPWRLRR